MTLVLPLYFLSMQKLIEIFDWNAKISRIFFPSQNIRRENALTIYFPIGFS